MSDIKMKLGHKRSTVELSFIFIDDYFTNCLPVYPLIYIWSFRRLLDGESVTVQEIGERFQLTEGDVLKAWRHWEKEKLVSVSSNKQGMEITFLSVEKKTPTPHKEATKETAVSGAEETLKLSLPETGVAAVCPPESRPQYTTQELACYRNDCQDVERLFTCAEKNLGKLLSYNDMNVIFSFHDWLRLPIDVIEYLLTYCAENDHRNLRYIEKCAIDWADRGIKDIEQALIYVQNFDHNYKTILRHMGQASSYPTPAQRKYMDTWLHQLNMPLKLITEAIDRCIEKINKFDKKYTEKILTEWHKKGIATIEEVIAADGEFIWKTKQPIRPAVKAKPNRFINFNQRENDYSHYEKLERAYLEKKYNS